MLALVFHLSANEGKNRTITSDRLKFFDGLIDSIRKIDTTLALHGVTVDNKIPNGKINKPNTTIKKK